MHTKRVGVELGGLAVGSEERDRSWTTEQLRVLDEVEATLKRAFGEARRRLSAVGVARDSGDFGCLRCSCEFYLARSPEGLEPGADFPGGGCMRIGCTHLITSHNII
jgi:hypothetical protein